MRRRDFIQAIVGSAIASPLTAWAQQSGRIRLIGVLINAPENDPEMQASLIALKQELERLNWLDGGNARFDIRFTEGNLDQMRGLTKKMVAMQPDVIFVHTSPLVEVAQKETSTIPIVFVMVSDPVGSGFVASLARPGGNLTGLLLYEESIVGKWLGMLKEIAPQMKRVAFIANPNASVYYYFLRTAQQVARSFAIELVPSPVDTATDIEGVIRSFADTPNGGLFFPPNVASLAHRDLIIGLAARYRLPAVYSFRYFPLEGGLMSYGVEQVDVFRQAASYVDRILRGAKPAELPVQAPTNYKTVVNLKTAKALGLDVPPSLLVRADEVIE
jgi:putative tryptophan/tyrosine transport system substrate-binding protein